MTIHRPGLPADLPEPGLLWARWALAAVLTARTGEESEGIHRTGTWVDANGTLRLDDCGSTRWWFERAGGDRWLLYGEDEASDVKWHRPPVDMLAGAPGWLPFDWLRDLLEGYELGCVYWYENGAWARAPYPDDLDDDGLDCGMSRFASARDVLEDVAERLEPAGDGAGPAALLAAAEEGRLTPADLEALAATGDHWDLPAMLRALAATAPETAPAG